MLINTGNISRKVLSKVLRSFVKNFERLQESEHFIDDNTLTVNVTRLRKKLEEIGLCEFIKTRKGIGYQIREEQVR